MNVQAEALCIVADGIPINGNSFASIPLPRQSLAVLIPCPLLFQAAAHEAQLRRWPRRLLLKGLQWFNLNRAELQVVTVIDGKGMEAAE